MEKNQLSRKLIKLKLHNELIKFNSLSIKIMNRVKSINELKYRVIPILKKYGVVRASIFG